jgi:hypothetical protein
MPADPTPAPASDTPADKPGGSVLASLLIPLALIAAAGVVFGVFYTLNRNAPPPAAPTPTTSSSTD